MDNKLYELPRYMPKLLDLPKGFIVSSFQNYGASNDHSYTFFCQMCGYITPSFKDVRLGNRHVMEVLLEFILSHHPQHPPILKD